MTTLINGAPVGDAEDRVRRLQLLGVPPEVIAPLIDYVDALNAAQLKLAYEQYPHLLDAPDEDRLSLRVHDGEEITDSYALRSYFNVDPDQTAAAKYLQVVNIEPHWQTGEPRPRSVHSVVIKATGEVCKSAGWRKGPAKSTSAARKGQPLVAYTLTDPDSFGALLSRLDTYGRYLYSK